VRARTKSSRVSFESVAAITKKKGHAIGVSLLLLERN
jgi:hypothetical protein